MTAHVQHIFSCPRCDSDIVDIKTTTSCPSCGLPLGKQDQLPYTPPYTLTEQHEKYRDPRTHVETFLNLPIEKANSIMNDALSLISVVAGKNTPTADIRKLVEMAIQIGEVARAYDSFLKAGGRHVPSFFIETTSSGAPNEPETTRAREHPPASPPDAIESLLPKMPGSGS